MVGRRGAEPGRGWFRFDYAWGLGMVSAAARRTVRRRFTVIPPWNHGVFTDFETMHCRQTSGIVSRTGSSPGALQRAI